MTEETTAANGAERPVLPVGFPMGPAFMEGTDETSTTCGIRRGEQLEEVSLHEYRLWGLAFDALPRSELIVRSQTAGVADAAEALDELLSRGLLVEFSDQPGDNRDLLRRFRLLPSGLGFGNTADQPDEFEIGFPGTGKLTAVDFRVYGVWGLSTRPQSIADACLTLAELAELPARSVMDQVAFNLPGLVARGLTYLDVP